MIEPTKNPLELHRLEETKVAQPDPNQPKKKGPLSFFSGAITSIVFAWLSLLLSRKVVIYFAVHSPSYSSSFAQNIASAMKTLAIGMCFLATFTFAFIGLGLTIVIIRSLMPVKTLIDD